jgi:hypothetical protein
MKSFKPILALIGSFTGLMLGASVCIGIEHVTHRHAELVVGVPALLLLLGGLTVWGFFIGAGAD